MGLRVGSTASGLRWPVGGSLFPDVFPDGFKDMMESVDSVLAKSKWLKPSLTGDTPVVDLNESGLYPVFSSSNAQNAGLPTASMGFVEVLYGNESYSKLTWIPMGTGTPWSRVRNSGTWGPWRPFAGSRGTIPVNTDMDTVRGPEWAGDWDMPLSPATNTLTGTLPTGHDAWLPGQFRVMGWAGGTTNLTSQLYMPYQSNGVWYRTIKAYVQTGALAWTPWVNLAAPAESGGSANALLVEDFTRRRGPVNTDGKGAVALRFDHGLSNFNSKIRPLLEARNLPYSLALNSRSWDLPENSGVTASMVNDWVAGGLAEVWNHGAHHVDATGTEALKDVIATGLEELRSQLPAASIDGWAVPGVGGTNYDGFNAGEAPDSFYGTEAGRLILANHAVSTGYIPGTARRKLDGTVRQGMGHYTLDTVTGTAAQWQINQAATDATGLQLMLHPSSVDKTGNITTAKLVEILDHIVAKRDAGELVVLSPYQLTLADAYTVTTTSRDHEKEKDTGWRKIETLSGVTGNVFLRRLGNDVHMMFHSVVVSTPGHVTVATIPASFQPQSITGANWRNGSVQDDAGTSVRQTSYSAGSIRILNAELGKQYGGYLTYICSADWPTSLPGNAV